MTVPFRTASAVVRVSEQEYEADIPDKWEQGRGAFGGLVFGILLRAAREHERDLTRVARSFACDIAGPVLVGKARVVVRELRRGRSQTNLQLELVQGAAVLASGICTMSGARGGSAPHHEPTPPPEASQLERAIEIPPLAGRPAFTEHYDYRNLGPIPLSGVKDATTFGFVREVAGEGALDASALSALLDSFWPALYPIATRPFPMTTVSFNAQFLPGDDLRADQPLFYRAHALTQREGYSVEFRELWTRERLVALNQQTFAVLG